MNILDYGLPLASFAGAGLAWYFAGRAKVDADAAWRACEVSYDRAADCSNYTHHCLRLAMVASKCAGLVHAETVLKPANTDAVDDKFAGILHDNDADVFDDNGYPKPTDQTAEHKALGEVC